MWTCPACGAHNSGGVDPCMCGQPKSSQKARSGVKPKLAADATPKLAADATPKLRKPRQQGTGGSRRYCAVRTCGKRVYADDCIRQNNDDYYHHTCFQERAHD